jgi:hypothetical protein
MEQNEQQPKRKTSKLVKIVVYIAAVFVFQELVFRFFFPIPEISNLDRNEYVVLEPGTEVVEYARNQAYYWESAPDTAALFESHMNAYGFRDKEWTVEKTTGKKRVLFVGDSFVEGLMAQQDETVPIAFEAAAGKGSYDVMNAGVLGVGLDVYLQLTADLTPLYKPDVVFVCLYANDLGREQPVVPNFFLEPEYFSSFKPRLMEVIQQMDDRGPLLFRWQGNSHGYIPACPKPANPWSYAADVLAPEVSPWLAEHMKNGTYNPFRTNGLAMEEVFLKQDPPLGQTVPFLKYICDQSGAELVLVYMPSRHQVTTHYNAFGLESCLTKCSDTINLTLPMYQRHQQVLAQQCQDFDVKFIDLTETVRAEEQRGNHLFWNYDEHMRGNGYKLLGKAIWDLWSGS